MDNDAAGGTDPGAMWLARLRRLDGEYRPPPGYLLLVQLLTALIIGLGAFILFRAWRTYQYTHALRTLLAGAGFGGGALIVGFMQQRRAACGYRLGEGQLRYISGVGRVLWSLELASVQRTELGPVRQGWPDYLLLHVGARTRRVHLLGSMKKALAALS